jgi:3D (Asp-Asp-Asp) domain-containing protein
MYAGDPFTEPQKVRCTCYVDRGTTASGKTTREGIVAGKREWIGCVAALYQVNEDGKLGDFIGYYEFLDTGYGIQTDYGGSIQLGQSIDVWQPSMKDAYNWVGQYGDYVYMKIIKGVG